MYRLLIVEDDMGIAEVIQMQAQMWDIKIISPRISERL